MDVFFVWSGGPMDYGNVLAVASAALRTPGATVHLLTDLPLTSPECAVLNRFENVQVEALRPELVLPAELLGPYQRTTYVQHRSDLLRFALLARHGGVYLDTDTITTVSLTTLPEEALFSDGTIVHCGVMRVPAGHPALMATVERLAKISDADLKVYQSIVYHWTAAVRRHPPLEGYCELARAFPVHWREWATLFDPRTAHLADGAWVLHHYGYFSSAITRGMTLDWLLENDVAFSRVALPAALELAGRGYRGVPTSFPSPRPHQA